MADTRPDIFLPANTPVDIYAALNAQAGFPAVDIGTQIRFVNKGNSEVYAYASATAPIIGVDRVGIPVLSRFGASNESGDSGAFVTSYLVDGLINVLVV